MGLNWSAVAGAASYNVYRSPLSGGGYVYLGNTTGTNYTDNSVDNANLGSTTAASRATTDQNGSRVATGSWSFFPASRTTVEVKYLYLQERNESTPVTDLGYLPQPFDAANPAAMGQYTDPTQSNLLTGGYEYDQHVNYKRHEVRAVFSQFLDVGGTRHQVKAGAGYELGEEELFRHANGWGQISRITVSEYFVCPGGGSPCSGAFGGIVALSGALMSVLDLAGATSLPLAGMTSALGCALRLTGYVSSSTKS